MTKPVDDRAGVVVAALTTADELLATCSTIEGCRSTPVPNWSNGRSFAVPLNR